MAYRGLGVVVAVLVGGGCTAFQAEIDRIVGADYDIPVTGFTPEVTLNLTEQVTRLEDQVNDRKDNSDDDRRNFLVLQALCETEPGRDCTVARFPIRIARFVWPFGCITRDAQNLPTYNQPDACTMPLTCAPTDQATMEAILNGGAVDPQNPPQGNGCVDVETWVSQMENYEDMTHVVQATVMDLSTNGSLKDIRQVKKVTVTRVTMKFKDNSLTYAIPQTHYFVGPVVSEAETQDGKQLIVDGKVTEFGILNEVAAMFNGGKNMQLTSEGKALLSDALRGFKATVAAQAVLVIPPATEAAREDNCKDPAHLVTNASGYCESFPKPGGETKLSVEMDVVFTVNAGG